MKTQDIRDRLLRVTRELLECVTELNANQHERLATSLKHMGELSPSGEDTIVHETKPADNVIVPTRKYCGKCGGAIHYGEYGAPKCAACGNRP